MNAWDPAKTTTMRTVSGTLKSTGTTLSVESVARVAISKKREKMAIDNTPKIKAAME